MQQQQLSCLSPLRCVSCALFVQQPSQSLTYSGPSSFLSFLVSLFFLLKCVHSRWDNDLVLKKRSSKSDLNPNFNNRFFYINNKGFYIISNTFSRKVCPSVWKNLFFMMGPPGRFVWTERPQDEEEEEEKVRCCYCQQGLKKKNKTPRVFALSCPTHKFLFFFPFFLFQRQGKKKVLLLGVVGQIGGISPSRIEITPYWLYTRRGWKRKTKRKKNLLNVCLFLKKKKERCAHFCGNSFSHGLLSGTPYQFRLRVGSCGGSLRIFFFFQLSLWGRGTFIIDIRSRRRARGCAGQV